MIQCKICNRLISNYNGLSLHIKTHNITSKEYYDKFIKKKDEEKCRGCGKLNTSFKNISNGYYKHCSPRCAQIDPDILEHKKKTFENHYGVSNIFQSKEFLDKQKIRNKKIKEIRILERGLIECQICGYESKSLYGLSKHIKRKHKISDKKYYDKYFKKLNEDKCKICGKQNRFYGLSQGYTIYCSKKCIWRDPKIKRKRQKTCFDKYGVSHPQQTEEAKKQNKLRQQDPVYRENMRNNLISQVEKQYLNGEPLIPCIGDDERECLNNLELEIKILIYRNKRLYGFFPDGRIKGTNILIEFDEMGHFDFDGNLKEKDIDRQIQLENKGFIFFRVKQILWLENTQQIINQFRQFIKENIKCQKI